MNRDRFDELVELVLEAEADPQQIAELDAMLRSDAVLLTEACDRLTEHRLLGLLFTPPDDAAAIESILDETANSDDHRVDAIMRAVNIEAPNRTGKPHRRRSRRGIPVAMVCGIGLLLVVGLFWGLRSDVDVPGMTGQTIEIATVVLDEGCEWADDREWVEGERISAGPIELVSGFAVLRFDGGAEMALQAGASLELLSLGSAKLVRGDVVIRAPEESAGFLLLTPASELRDLGTEFSVSVDADGATELDVLEGEVAVRPLEADDPKPSIYRTSQAVAIDTASSRPRSIPSTGKRFATVIKEATLPSRWELTYAYEGFFYDEGQVPLKRSRRGKGWSGPWRLRTEAEGFREAQDRQNFLDIVHGRMNVTWSVPGGKLGMLRLPRGQAVRLRSMRRPVDLSRNKIYYVSFMLQVPETGEERRHDEFRLTFRSSDDYFGESVSFGVPRGRGARVQTGLGVGFRSRSPLPEGQSLLCVAKITCKKNGEDVVRFRVFADDEPIGSLEPRDWDVMTQGLNLSAKLDLAVITSVGPTVRILDELRIGPTWRSIVPIEGKPVEQKRAPGDAADQ